MEYDLIVKEVNKYNVSNCKITTSLDQKAKKLGGFDWSRQIHRQE